MATKLVVKNEFPQLMLDDLARSGLTLEDAHSMRLEFKSGAWADENLGIPRSGYKIPFFDSHGNPIPISDSNPEQMYRFRFLDFAEAQQFNGKKVVTEQLKYAQPFGTKPKPYFSTRIDWDQAFADPIQEIGITEGEKKAEAACKAGIPTIGLGGVYAFRSASRELFFLPELHSLPWKDRPTHVCFDSDVMVKKEVQGALSELTKQLVRRGANVSFIFLEPLPELEKVGLDDFILAMGAQAYRELPRQQSKLSEAFDILNQRAGLVETQGAYWDFKNDIFMDPSHAKEVLSTLATVAKQVKGGGLKEVPAFDEWRISPKRRSLVKVVYEPGNTRQITAENNLNMWRQSKLVPKRGNVGLWLDMVNHVMGKPEYVKHFLQWLAYPLQFPGTKHFTAVFVYGEKQGTGKSFIITPLMDFIYGDNFTRIENSQLEDGFNGDQGSKQLILMDEIYVSDYRGRGHIMSTLKNMITREKVSINEKNMRRYNVIDYSNLYATSNHVEALPLPSDDRRWNVYRAPDVALPESAYAELDSKMRGDKRDTPGPLAQAIYHYLKYKVDVSNFNPHAPAQITEWRAEVIQAANSPLEEFAERVAYTPEEVFGRGMIRHLVTGADLLDHYYRKYPKAAIITVFALGKALAKYKHLIPKKEARVNSKSVKHTLYAVMEREVWALKSQSEWATYHEASVEARNS